MRLFSAMMIGLLAAGTAMAMGISGAYAQTQPQTVTLAADEWCPYNCAAGSERPGYMVEIAQYAFAKLGRKVDYVVTPWSRALAEAEIGRVDGVIGATRSEFQKGVFPQTAMGKSVNVLVLTSAAAEGFVYTGVESLKKLRIGGVKDYSYDQGPIDAYFASDEAKGKVELLSGAGVQTQNLRKLLNGRIDAWIENRNVVALTMAETPEAARLKTVVFGEPDEVFVALSPAKPASGELAAALDAAMLELRQSGELGKILAKYNLTDWN